MANEDIDILIAKVQRANLESDLRNMKTKARSKASDTSKMNPVYKPKASPGPASNTINMYGAPKSNFTYSAPKADTAKASPKADRSNVRESRVSSKSTSKPESRVKDTSFNKGGLIPALTSGNAKKFKNTFGKKGLLPALRGK
jgi:hypothetical protein